MPLNIIYVHNTDIGKNDTSETFVILNALSLAKQDTNVHLIIRNSSNNDSLDLIKKKYGIEGIPTNLTISTYNKNSKSNFKFYLFSASYLIKFKQPTVIITRSHGVIPYLLTVRKKYHKIIFETHDYFYNLTIRNDLNRKQLLKKNIIEKLFLKKFDAIICLNPYQKSLYDTHLDANKIKVFPTGLAEVFQPLPKTGKKVVYIGSLSARMGIENIVAILPNLDKNIEIVIVGGKTKAEIETFKKMFHNKILPKNIRITGWINKDALKKELSNASAGLLPLQNTFFNRYLTVPLKMFDYLAFGLPVIATKMPSLTEYIKHEQNGIFVDWENHKETANTINHLLSSTTLLEELSANALIIAESITWDKRAKLQYQYFSKLITS